MMAYENRFKIKINDFFYTGKILGAGKVFGRQRRSWRSYIETH